MHGFKPCFILRLLRVEHLGRHTRFYNLADGVSYQDRLIKYVTRVKDVDSGVSLARLLSSHAMYASYRCGQPENRLDMHKIRCAESDGPDGAD